MKKNYHNILVDGKKIRFYPDEMLFYKGSSFPKDVDKDRNVRPSVCKSVKIANSRKLQLALTITKSCNMKCTYCYDKKNMNISSNSKNMHFSTLCDAVNKFCNSRIGNYNIHFIGGEPLLCLDLIKQTVDYCNKKAAIDSSVFTYSISTNGTIIDKAIAKYFSENKIKIRLTFDGVEESQNVNRPMRNREQSFSHVVRSLSNLRNASCDFSVISVLHPNFLHKMLKAFENIIQYNPNAIKFVPLINIDALGCKYVSDHSVMFAESLRNIANQLISRKDEKTIMKIKNISVYLPYIHNRIANIKGCIAVNKQSYAVNVDGSVYPCSTFVGIDTHRLGMINDYELNPNSIKCESITTRCLSCWARTLCPGVCAYTADNNSACSSAMNCEFIKGEITVALEVYSKLYPHKIRRE
ncbi:MAG: radical SAM protein [Pseudomonadota bacterium]